MTERRIRSCAVIGCGHIGRRHAEILKSHPDFRLHALVDLLPKRAEGFDVPVYPELQYLLESELKPELVTLATPNGLHARQAIRVLEAGCHVLIEKPMALSSEDAAAIIRAAEAAERQVAVVMQNRYAPAARWLKGLVSGGKLGRILLVQVSLLWNRDERYYTTNSWHGDPGLDGGTLFTQFSHFIDLLWWLFGDLTNIQSRWANLNHPNLKDFDDTGVVQFDLQDGGMGSLSFTTATWDRNAESNLTIVGEWGTVRLGGQYMDEIQWSQIRDYSHSRVESELALIRNDYKEESAHARVYSHLASVLNGSEPSLTSASDGKKVVELIEQMYQLGKTSG